MENSVNELVASRIAFFGNRVDAYAAAKGLTNKTVIPHLMDLALKKGTDQITNIIDEVVPAELHSSNMPPIIKMHY